MNKLYSLVDDIYKVVSEKEPADGVDLYDEIERFGENCKRLMANLFTEKRDGRKLRMSNIGRDDRYLWNVVNNPDVQEEMTPKKYVKLAVLRGLWIVKLTVLSQILKVSRLLGLRNSKTEVWLMMIRLDTLLKLKGMHTPKGKPSLAG
jgi:hypothetical protein